MCRGARGNGLGGTDRIHTELIDRVANLVEKGMHFGLKGKKI